MGSNITHVANASGKPLRVYYNSSRMNLEEIGLTFGIQIGHSVSVSAEANVEIKPNPNIRCICIPPKDFGKILGEGDIFVTVFVEDGADPEDWQNISQNFYIPKNRSFIVTKNRNLKWQKYGANIWEDEQGNNHRH